jgi:heat shock protein HspQ
MIFRIAAFDGSEPDKVKFKRGELILHKLYGYRGVIVTYDTQCQAGEKWYLSNKTQPPRDQPWYQVLVDQSGGLSTYVAQSNLKSDSNDDPVDHPRLQNYFSEFKDGVYT